MEALRGVNIDVKQGELFGFLGPNGAGKTTTIRCLLDMIRPQSGSICILGIDPQKTPKAVHTQIGYLPGELNIEANLRVKSALRHFTELRGNNVEWDYAHQGYMDTYYFSYMTIILGIFAISACANLLVSDEEKGILDLLMA